MELLTRVSLFRKGGEDSLEPETVRATHDKKKEAVRLLLSFWAKRRKVHPEPACAALEYENSTVVAPPKSAQHLTTKHSRCQNSSLTQPQGGRIVEQQAVLLLIEKCFGALARGRPAFIVRGDDAPSDIIALETAVRIHMCDHDRIGQPSFQEQEDSLLKMAIFDLSKVSCSNDADRQFILTALVEWYGSTAAFTDYVRGPLRAELVKVAEAATAPLSYCLLIYSPALGFSVDVLGALWNAGAPSEVIWSYFIGETISNAITSVAITQQAGSYCETVSCSVELDLLQGGLAKGLEGFSPEGSHRPLPAVCEAQVREPRHGLGTDVWCASGTHGFAVHVCTDVGYWFCRCRFEHRFVSGLPSVPM